MREERRGIGDSPIPPDLTKMKIYKEKLMKKKFIFALIALCTLTCAFGMGACDNKNNDSTGNESSSVLPLEVAEKKIEMILGETKQISVLSLEEGETVSYTSNDETVVTVSAEGVVEGVKIGSAVVKATTSLGRSTLIQVTVYDPEFYPVPYISVAQDALTKCVGDSFTIGYTYTYLGVALDGAVEITSDNPSVVRVDGQTLTAVGVGEANIVLSGTSSYGTATRTVKITVAEVPAEFYPSFLGKDIYVGNNLSLAMYVNADGKLSVLEDATFSVKDTDLAVIEEGELVPLDGGDTEITVEFTYGEKNYSKTIPIHIFGLNTCSFMFADGTVDYTVQAFYGETIPLKIENALANPEYNKGVKCWYVNGEEVVGDSFVMPDEDVVVDIRLVNDTKEDFSSQFSAGHLLNNLQANAKYVKEPFVDGKGVSSDFGGYVRFGDNGWASLSYNFDTPVIVNEYASVKMKVYMPAESMLLYFGYASSADWSAENPTKRYEASAGVHKSGDVPLYIIPENEWTTIELPLSAFVDKLGDPLNGISISVASGAIYIDYILVDEGLAVNDPVYMDNVLCQEVLQAENGSNAQINAIMAYYRWSVGLTEELRATQTHQANVAAIKQAFANFDGGKITGSLSNAPTVSGAVYYGDRGAGDEHCHVDYKSQVYQNIYMTQFKTDPHDAKFTLKAFNFNEYGEVYFGLYMISDAVAWAPTRIDAAYSMTILGQTFEGNTKTSQAHYFKVSIKDGVLTVIDDSKNNIDGGAVIFTVLLPEDVLNGTKGLEIDFNFEAWAQVENTSLCTVLTADDII